MTVYADGWSRLDSEVGYISGYWLDGFPVAATPEEQLHSARGPENRVSPIYDYNDGGVGAIQWLNVTHNVAATLVSDGGWKTGGIFHPWVSTGVGTIPYEVPLLYPIKIDAGDHSGWIKRREDAILAAEAILGLRRLSE